jgi:S1-C subfamily serine protease
LPSPSQISDFISNLPQESTSTALANAARSTLVFAQHEAGTAVCIAASGLLLTCSHCVADSQEEYAEGNPHWLIFSSGQVVQAKCVAWDARRDLALLQIVAAEDLGNSSSPSFPFAIIAPTPPAAPKTKKTPLICIGHPGSEDLEAVASSSPVPSNYDVLHVSYGHYRGMARGQDVHDNSEIGALKHDCWTYWGHSGAPLITAESGEVIGLHSSWDDQTGMRRGIGWEALDGFLREWCMEA